MRGVPTYWQDVWSSLRIVPGITIESMDIGRQLYYRAEQYVLWQSLVSVAELAQEFGISQILAMKLLIRLELDGIIIETDEEGVYRTLITRPLNANDANREIHQLLSAATRCARDANYIDKETFAGALGLSKKRAQELLKLMQELGVIEKVQMYRALSEVEAEERGKRWYDPYESSVQLLDADGESQMVFHKYDDAIYPEVEKFVIEVGKASSSLLQRRFKIGYARAARLIDILEEEGVVGPADGANPRKVLKQPPRDFDLGENEDLNRSTDDEGK